MHHQHNVPVPSLSRENLLAKIIFDCRNPRLLSMRSSKRSSMFRKNLRSANVSCQSQNHKSLGLPSPQMLLTRSGAHQETARAHDVGKRERPNAPHETDSRNALVMIQTHTTSSPFLSPLRFLPCLERSVGARNQSTQVAMVNGEQMTRCLEGCLGNGPRPTRVPQE